jgi:hypothetical protein
VERNVNLRFNLIHIPCDRLNTAFDPADCTVNNKIICHVSSSPCFELYSVIFREAYTRHKITANSVKYVQV